MALFCVCVCVYKGNKDDEIFCSFSSNLHANKQNFAQCFIGVVYTISCSPGAKAKAKLNTTAAVRICKKLLPKQESCRVALKIIVVRAWQAITFVVSTATTFLTK